MSSASPMSSPAASAQPTITQRAQSFLPKETVDTLKNLDGETLKKVAAVGALALPFLAPSVALTAVLLAIPVKVLIDGPDKPKKEQTGEKGLYDAIGDIMTLGTAILMITPASISMGIVALSVAASVIMPSKRDEVVRQREGKQNAESSSKPQELNLRGWMIYTAESICGYSLIQTVYHVAKMSFSSEPHVHLLTSATYLLIAKLSKSYAEQTEKELGIDLNENVYSDYLAKMIWRSAPVAYVRTKVSEAFSKKPEAA